MWAKDLIKMIEAFKIHQICAARLEFDRHLDGYQRTRASDTNNFHYHLGGIVSMFQRVAAVYDIEMTVRECHMVHIHHQDVSAEAVEINPVYIPASFYMKIIQFGCVATADAQYAAPTEIHLLSQPIHQDACSRL